MAQNYVAFHRLHFMVNSLSFHGRFMALSAVVFVDKFLYWLNA